MRRSTAIWHWLPPMVVMVPTLVAMVAMEDLVVDLVRAMRDGTQ
jgi:hypothetical protein